MYSLSREDTSQIQIIRAVVADSDCEVLDRRVYLTEKYIDALQTISHNNPAIYCYADVPIGSITTLGHANFWELGQTWRQIILDWESNEDGLHGQGWQPEVFQYFEDELRERSFPAWQATGPLKLISIGGVVDCESGNHRLVGAVGWLAGRYGKDVYLKKARLQHRPVDLAVIGLIGDLHAKGFDISVRPHNYQQKGKGFFCEQTRELSHGFGAMMAKCAYSATLKT